VIENRAGFIAVTGTTGPLLGVNLFAGIVGLVATILGRGISLALVGPIRDRYCLRAWTPLLASTTGSRPLRFR
jgi:hypothetical protein